MSVWTRNVGSLTTPAVKVGRARLAIELVRSGRGLFITRGLTSGAHFSPSAKTPPEHEHAAMFLAGLVVSWAGFALVPMAVPAIARFEALAKAHRNVKRNDLRIAALALELGATVVTRNRRNFSRISGLAIEDWSI